MDKPKAVLLFELGKLQVFHYPVDSMAITPTEVYWQDKESMNTYGPFNSVHSAMTHFTWLSSLEKATTAVNDDKNVIHVDFVKKSRIV